MPRRKRKNSRAKGKRGELEAAVALREHLFVEARRGRQFQGTQESPDLKTSLDEDFHFEVKRREKISLPKTLAQAEAECGGKIPVIQYRWNNGPWLLIFRLPDMLRSARIIARPRRANIEAPDPRGVQ